MARFKRKARRLFARTKKTYRRYGTSSGVNLLTVGLMAAAYGALRPKIQDVIPAAVSNFAGGYGDEILLGGAGYLAAKGKLGSNSMIKNAGMAVFIVEATRLGSGIGAGMVGSSTGTSDANLLG